MSLLNENPVPTKSFVESAAFKWILVVIIVAVAGIIAYFTYNAFFKEVKEQSLPQVGAENQAELDALYAAEVVPAPVGGVSSLSLDSGTGETASGVSGYIVFTGLNLDGGETNEVFFIDPTDSATVAKRFLPDFVKYSAFAEFTDVMNPTEFFMDSMYFEMSDFGGYIPPSNHSVQKYNIANGTLKGFKSIIGEYVQNLDWSNAVRKLAFTRQTQRPELYSDLLPIENSEIVISNTDTDEVELVLQKATKPHWSPDGSQLLILRSDGLYVYDVASKTEENVVPVTDGKILTTSMTDLSPDGTRLAWTHGKSGVISMYEIASWKPFEIKEIGRIESDKTEYFWPLFSPDGNYYIVQAIDSALPGATERLNPRFEIRPTLSKEVVWTYPLTQFDFNSFFTDAWIQNLPTSPTSQ